MKFSIEAFLALWQDESNMIEIEFVTERDCDAPKLQRLGFDPTGQILFIRHILPFEEGHAMLYPSFGESYRGRRDMFHRTILVLNANSENLDAFEWVSSIFI